MTRMMLVPNQERARQHAVRAYGLAGADAWAAPDQQLLDLARLAHRILDAERCAINILDDQRQWSMSSSTQVPFSVSDRAVSICQRVLSQAAFDGGVFVTDDASESPLLADSVWVSGEVASIRFYACAPLITPEGLVLGTACAWAEQRIDFGARERSELLAFSTAVMGVLDERRAALAAGDTGDGQVSGSGAGS